MAINEDLKDALLNVAVAAIQGEYPGVPVILSHQNGSEPVNTYCTINLLRQTQVGHKTDSTLTNSTFDLEFSAPRELMVQFSFFGSSSGDVCYHFDQQLNNPIILQKMWENDLGYLRKSQVRFNPQKRETQWIDSYNVDVYFSYTTKSKQRVDYIDAVIIRENSDSPFVVPKDYHIDNNP